MALPLTLTGLSTSVAPVGQFKSSGGSYYFFGRDGTTATTLQAYKATDPTSSWSSVATKTGFSTAIQFLTAYRVGDIIHMIVADGSSGSVNYKYQTFDMSSDTFVTAETAVSAINTNTNGGTAHFECSVVVRSGGEVVFGYAGPQHTNMGAQRSSAYYTRRTGVNTWAAGVEVDAGGANDFWAMLAFLGDSDSVHFCFYNNTGPAINVRTLNSSNVLQTNQANTTNPGNGNTGRRGSFNNAGTTRCFLGYSLFLLMYFDSAANPTLNFTSTLNSSTNDNQVFYDGTANLYLIAPGTGNDMFENKSTDQGANWGTAVSQVTGTMTTMGSPLQSFLSRDGEVYTRTSGAATYLVIPYIFNDLGTIKYNEFNISISVTNTITQAESFAGSSQTFQSSSTPKNITVTSAETTTLATLKVRLQTCLASIGQTITRTVIKTLSKLIVIRGDVYDWTDQAGSGTLSWSGVGSSDTGKYLVASSTGTGSGVYRSTDYGVTWTNVAPMSASWVSADIADDGLHIVAAVQGGDIWTSSDGGQNWVNVTETFSGISGETWISVVISPDGSKIAAAAEPGDIYHAPFGGSPFTGAGLNLNFTDLAASDDFSVMLASELNTRVYRSLDGGVTFSIVPGLPNTGWMSVALSPDGTKAVAGNFNGDLWYSEDSGATWNKRTGFGSHQFGGVTVSADGTRIFAFANDNNLYSSSDRGITVTTQTGAGSHVWSDMAASRDGMRVAAAPTSVDIQTAAFSGGKRQNIFHQHQKLANKQIAVSWASAISLLRQTAKTITAALSELVTAGTGAQQQKLINITSAESVTLARVKSLGVVITVASAELVTLARATSRLVSVVSAQGVSLVRQTAHSVTAAISQAASVTRTATLNKLLNISSAESVTLTKTLSLSQLITAAQAQLVTLARTTSHLISLTQAQLVTLARTTSHLISLTQAQAVSLLKAVGHLVSFVSTELVTLVPTQGQQTFNQACTALQAQSVTLLKQVGKILSAAQSQLVLGNVTPSISAGTLVTGQSITLLKRTSKTITLGLAQTVSLLRRAGHIITVLSAQVVTLARTFAISRTISITSAELVTLTKTLSLSALISLSQAQVITLQRAVGHLVSVTSAGLTTLQRQTAHLIALVQSEVVTLNATRSLFTQTITFAQAQAVTLTRLVAQSKLITVVQAQSVSLLRQISHLVALTQSQLVSLQRRIAHTITTLSAQSVSLLRYVGKTILVGTTQSVIMSAINAVSKTITVTTGSLVTLATGLIKSLSVGIGQAINLDAIRMRICDIDPGTLVTTLTKTVSTTLALNIVQLVTVLRQQPFFRGRLVCAGLDIVARVAASFALKQTGGAPSIAPNIAIDGVEIKQVEGTPKVEKC